MENSTDPATVHHVTLKPRTKVRVHLESHSFNTWFYIKYESVLNDIGTTTYKDIKWITVLLKSNERRKPGTISILMATNIVLVH